MKLVVAIIRTEKLQAVQSALKKQNIDQMTVANVVGSGNERGRTLIYRSTTIEESLIPRLRLEIAVEDSLVEGAVEAIQTHGETGQIGDGVIFVMTLEKFAHIRASDSATAHRKWEVRPGTNDRSWRSLVAAN
jgi:nitrogen regulatory protein PII